jgi:hypothetical protein
MKLIIYFSFFLLCFVSEIQAQRTDSTARIPLMKSKYLIFIAELNTSEGLKKGILYDADSSGIVILDSSNQLIRFFLSEIKSIKIKNSKAGLRGFNSGFYPITAMIMLIVLPQIIIYGLPAAGTWEALGLATFTLGGIGAGLILGGIFAILSASIPSSNIDLEKYPKKYLRQLKYIKLKTQQRFVKKLPKKIRLV